MPDVVFHCFSGCVDLGWGHTRNNIAYTQRKRDANAADEANVVKVRQGVALLDLFFQLRIVIVVLVAVVAGNPQRQMYKGNFQVSIA